jgi:hypothetical protein
MCCEVFFLCACAQLLDVLLLRKLLADADTGEEMNYMVIDDPAITSDHTVR